MAQTLDEARAAARQAIIDTAQEYIDKAVPSGCQITGSMLIGFAMTQQPPLTNMAGMLFPLFQFIATMQGAAQPFIAQALAAGNVADAYAAADAFDPSVVPLPKLDVWGTKYPQD